MMKQGERAVVGEISTVCFGCVCDCVFVSSELNTLTQVILNFLHHSKEFSGHMMRWEHECERYS